MQYALLVVEMQDADRHGEPNQKWLNFLERSASIRGSFEPATTLGPNCWLLPLQKMLPAFSALMRQATQSNLQYKVAFLNDFPEWCSSIHTS